MRYPTNHYKTYLGLMPEAGLWVGLGMPIDSEFSCVNVGLRQDLHNSPAQKEENMMSRCINISPIRAGGGKSIFKPWISETSRKGGWGQAAAFGVQMYDEKRPVVKTRPGV